MNEFEARITALFIREMKKIFLVFDVEDRLQGHLCDMIKQKGFRIYFYESPLQLRYVYEKDIRLQIETDKNIDCIIVIPRKFAESTKIPPDIEREIERVDLRVGKIYPKIPSEYGSQIPTKILNVLDKELIDLTNSLAPKDLTEIIFRNLLHFSQTSWNNPETIFLNLFSFFESEWRTEPFLTHLVNDSIPLNFRDIFLLNNQKIINQSQFFEWLNQKWQDFVISLSKTVRVHYVFDFNIPILRDCIIGTIQIGKISPCLMDDTKNLPEWVLKGVRIDFNKAFEKEFQSLNDFLDEFKGKDLTKDDWENVIQRMALIEYYISQLPDERIINESVLQLFDRIDAQFGDWIKNHYLSLHQKSSIIKPNFISQILPYIFRKRNTNEIPHKIVLFVLDALSLFAWKTIKDTFNLPKEFGLSCSLVLAEIPTITGVCRSSLIGGKPPWACDPNFLSHISDEKDLWENFWSSKNSIENINYISMELGSLDFESIESKLLETQSLSIVINDLDKMVHTSYSYTQLVTQIKDLTNKKLLPLINLLLKKGFWIYISGDHGFRRCAQNINISSILPKSSKLFIQSKGGRFILSERNEEENEHFYKINSSDLLNHEQLWLYLAKGSETFSKNKLGFDHGGISISEMIIPYIQIEKKMQAEID